MLLHLEKKGFAHSPRHLGIDEKGRDILTYIEGPVGHDLTHSTEWSLDALSEAAKLLRSYHDAVSDFTPPADAIWNLETPSDLPTEIIAHNDFAPYNCVYRDRLPFALIDFDTASPASRSWDLAYSAYRFVPLSDPENFKAALPLIEAEIPQRLKRFLDVYSFNDRASFIQLVIRRVQAIRDHTKNEAAKSDPNAKRIQDEGHLAFYDRDLQYLQQHSAKLQKSIT